MANFREKIVKNTLLLLSIVVLSLIGLTEYRNYRSRQIKETIIERTPLIEEGLSFNIDYKLETIRVQKGHEFELMLKDVGWIKGQLVSKTPEVAQKKVLKLLNDCTQPRVILLEKRENFWTVDLKFTSSEGKDTSLTAWLKAQGLLFN